MPRTSKQQHEERAADRVKRLAEQPSAWPWFVEFWTAFTHPPVTDAGSGDLLKYVAQGLWESARPSLRVVTAILLVLKRHPDCTLDAETKRRLSAAEWLVRLWPGPTAEDLDQIIAGTFETPSQAEAAALAKLLAMIEVGPQPGPEA